MASAVIVVVFLGAATMLFKAAGPVLLEGRPLPPAAMSVVVLLGPSLLAALIATSTFEGDRSLVLDARVLGVLAAAGALKLRLPSFWAVVLAAGTTALVRAL